MNTNHFDVSVDFLDSGYSPEEIVLWIKETIFKKLEVLYNSSSNYTSQAQILVQIYTKQNFYVSFDNTFKGLACIIMHRKHIIVNKEKLFSSLVDSLPFVLVNRKTFNFLFKVVDGSNKFCTDKYVSYFLCYLILHELGHYFYTIPPIKAIEYYKDFCNSNHIPLEFCKFVINVVEDSFIQRKFQLDNPLQVYRDYFLLGTSIIQGPLAAISWEELLHNAESTNGVINIYNKLFYFVLRAYNIHNQDIQNVYYKSPVLGWTDDCIKYFDKAICILDNEQRLHFTVETLLPELFNVLHEVVNVTKQQMQNNGNGSLMNQDKLREANVVEDDSTDSSDDSNGSDEPGDNSQESSSSSSGEYSNGEESDEENSEEKSSGSEGDDSDSECSDDDTENSSESDSDSEEEESDEENDEEDSSSNSDGNSEDEDTDEDFDDEKDSDDEEDFDEDDEDTDEDESEDEEDDSEEEDDFDEDESLEEEDEEEAEEDEEDEFEDEDSEDESDSDSDSDDNSEDESTSSNEGDSSDDDNSSYGNGVSGDSSLEDKFQKLEDNFEKELEEASSELNDSLDESVDRDYPKDETLDINDVDLSKVADSLNEIRVNHLVDNQESFMYEKTSNLSKFNSTGLNLFNTASNLFKRIYTFDTDDLNYLDNGELDEETMIDFYTEKSLNIFKQHRDLVESKNIKIFFLVDDSGSMSGDRAKSLRSIIPALMHAFEESNIETCLYAFGSDCYLIKDFKDKVYLSGDRSNLQYAFNCLDDGGGTNIVPALSAISLKEFDEDTIYIMFIFTDGYVNDEDIASELFTYLKEIKKVNLFGVTIDDVDACDTLMDLMKVSEEYCKNYLTQELTTVLPQDIYNTIVNKFIKK